MSTGDILDRAVRMGAGELRFRIWRSSEIARYSGAVFMLIYLGIDTADTIAAGGAP